MAQIVSDKELKTIETYRPYLEAGKLEELFKNMAIVSQTPPCSLFASSNGPTGLVRKVLNENGRTSTPVNS